jgi:hypothetical protein
MPRYRIIVADPVKYAARFSGSDATPGAVHAVADSECPLGRPNCRCCGDPSTPCEEVKGNSNPHCRQCGVDHGIAPDAILAANGLVLELEQP